MIGNSIATAVAAARDQEHVPAIISAIPQMPDRTQAFRGEGESPLPYLVDATAALARRAVEWSRAQGLAA